MNIMDVCAEQVQKAHTDKGRSVCIQEEAFKHASLLDVFAGACYNKTAASRVFGLITGVEGME